VKKRVPKSHERWAVRALVPPVALERRHQEKPKRCQPPFSGTAGTVADTVCLRRATKRDEKVPATKSEQAGEKVPSHLFRYLNRFRIRPSPGPAAGWWTGASRAWVRRDPGRVRLSCLQVRATAMSVVCFIDRPDGWSRRGPVAAHYPDLVAGTFFSWTGGGRSDRPGYVNRL